MDNSFEQQEAEVQSKTIFSANLLKIVDNILIWVLNPFQLTEEEKKKAGIYIGCKGEDD